MKSISALIKAYKGGLDPKVFLLESLAKAKENSDKNIWITLLSEEKILEYLNKLPDNALAELPLYGVPFAIKDNIDLAGVQTTAACPGFAYVPDKSAYTVELLLKAGAIPLGKTNMDQFATGLVGTRSPYGQCQNSIDPKIISGGSSAGSAVSVALEEVFFSLGTDTAGSGRVPAALNNIWGLKPSKGRLSCTGVVPACKSLDCVSIFAKSANDLNKVLNVVSHYDSNDVYASDFSTENFDSIKENQIIKIGIPQKKHLEFFNNKEYEQAYEKAVALFKSNLDFKVVEIDYSCFKETAEILYGGPWVAERFVAIEKYLATNPTDLDAAVSSIVLSSEALKVTEAYKAFYKLQSNLKKSERVFKEIDFILTPTIGTFFSRAEIDSEPIKYNSQLGYYTNHMNLLNLCGLAFPGGIVQSDKLENKSFPFGLTLQGPSGCDAKLLEIAEEMAPLLNE